MRRSRGRLTLGVHKIPFLEFSPLTAIDRRIFGFISYFGLLTSLGR
jgi:hypothetical protein